MSQYFSKCFLMMPSTKSFNLDGENIFSIGLITLFYNTVMYSTVLLAQEYRIQMRALITLVAIFVAVTSSKCTVVP